MRNEITPSGPVVGWPDTAMVVASESGLMPPQYRTLTRSVRLWREPLRRFRFGVEDWPHANGGIDGAMPSIGWLARSSRLNQRRLNW